jgi:hypothetical protein
MSWAVCVDPAEGQIVAGVVTGLDANSERESAFRDLRFLISNGNGEAAGRCFPVLLLTEASLRDSLLTTYAWR